MFEENRPYPESGRLQIDVLEEGEVMPVENARVRIAPHRNAELMIGEMLTDDSGQTPIIDLPAPPSEYSLQPELGYMPYSEYDVTVDMPGYDVVTVSGVQILPDTTSFLRVELPHSQFAQGTTIEISEHTLWGEFPPKIPEDEVKQMPEATGLVVLPEPVVPEIIVVHDGAPTNRNARRFYVPFTDYI
ncbi:MAG: carboxypeptidase-like regulatory domain-containing protein, partial [Defluviitaleaceae bacterium]|nr:carboxypeptidase-like regulatory domain-containing protein [Defluviitaleaceae bacterium]